MIRALCCVADGNLKTEIKPVVSDYPTSVHVIKYLVVPVEIIGVMAVGQAF
jgi:hypothetical protein